MLQHPVQFILKQDNDLEWWGNSIWEYYAATEGGGTVVDADSWSEVSWNSWSKHGLELKSKSLTMTGLRFRPDESRHRLYETR